MEVTISIVEDIGFVMIVAVFTILTCALVVVFVIFGVNIGESIFTVEFPSVNVAVGVKTFAVASFDIVGIRLGFARVVIDTVVLSDFIAVTGLIVDLGGLVVFSRSANFGIVIVIFLVIESGECMVCLVMFIALLDAIE